MIVKITTSEMVMPTSSTVVDVLMVILQLVEDRTSDYQVAPGWLLVKK